MKLSVYTDGGSRGNPGPSGFGIVVYDDNKNIITKISKYIGIRTNNEAEYSALISALSWLLDNKDVYQITDVIFYADSQLLIRQMQGKYKVKAVNIKPLYLEATKLLQNLNISFKFHDVRRELNAEADALANLAMDRKTWK